VDGLLIWLIEHWEIRLEIRWGWRGKLSVMPPTRWSLISRLGPANTSFPPDIPERELLLSALVGLVGDTPTPAFLTEAAAEGVLGPALFQ
jgi:hypothetical protein